MLTELDKANVASALIAWFKSRNIDPDDAHDIMAIVIAGEAQSNPSQTFRRLKRKILHYINIVQDAKNQISQ